MNRRSNSGGGRSRWIQPAILGGGDPAILAKVGDRDRRKFAAMGYVLLSTAGMAALSAGFALHMVFAMPILIVTVLALLWGLVIVNLDRMLVLTMGSERSAARLLGLAVPRVILAVIIGTVISTPITLAIFAKEIASEVSVMQAEDEAAFKNQMDSDPGFKTIPSLEQQVAALQTIVIVKGEVDVDADPSVKAALAERAVKQKIFNDEYLKFLDLQHHALCEADGTCGTHVAGYGPQQKADQAAADAQKSLSDAASRDLSVADAAVTRAREQVAAQAPARLAAAKSDLHAATANLQNQQNRESALIKHHDSLVADSDGLLYRLEALSRLAGRHGVVGWAHWLLWSLFTCIELLPVLVKVLMNLGGNSAYDTEAERQDQQRADINEIERDLETFGAHDLADQQKALVVEMNATVVAHQKQATEDALDVWSAHAKQQSRQQLAAYQASLGGGAPAPAEPVVDGAAARPADSSGEGAANPDGTVNTHGVGRKHPSPPPNASPSVYDTWQLPKDVA